MISRRLLELALLSGSKPKKYGPFANLLLAFAAVTIATIVGLTLTACSGGYQLRGQWLERWGDVFTALTLIIIGALALMGVI